MCALYLNQCVLFRKEMENQHHLLIHCSFTRCHWFLKETGLVWKLPRSTHELFDADLGCDIGMRGGIFYE